MKQYFRTPALPKIEWLKYRAAMDGKQVFGTEYPCALSSREQKPQQLQQS